MLTVNYEQAGAKARDEGKNLETEAAKILDATNRVAFRKGFLYEKFGTAKPVGVDATLAERGGTHGDYRAQGAFADALVSLMEKTPNWKLLKPFQRDALRIEAVKNSRILHGDPDFVDHWHDKAGYNTLVESALTGVSK